MKRYYLLFLPALFLSHLIGKWLKAILFKIQQHNTFKKEWLLMLLPTIMIYFSVYQIKQFLFPTNQEEINITIALNTNLPNCAIHQVLMFDTEGNCTCKDIPDFEQEVTQHILNHDEDEVYFIAGDSSVIAQKVAFIDVYSFTKNLIYAHEDNRDFPYSFNADYAPGEYYLVSNGEYFGINKIKVEPNFNLEISLKRPAKFAGHSYIYRVTSKYALTTNESLLIPYKSKN